MLIAAIGSSSFPSYSSMAAILFNARFERYVFACSVGARAYCFSKILGGQKIGVVAISRVYFPHNCMYAFQRGIKSCQTLFFGSSSLTSNLFKSTGVHKERNLQGAVMSPEVNHRSLRIKVSRTVREI